MTEREQDKDIDRDGSEGAATHPTRDEDKDGSERDDAVDDQVEDTFPASDPPAW